MDGLGGHIQIAFLPPYAPDLNPVEYLWAWLKRHALANYCPNDLTELHATARNKLKSAQKRPSIIAACWMQATLCRCHELWKSQLSGRRFICLTKLAQLTCSDSISAENCSGVLLAGS